MKPSSITRPATRQTGYALILMVLGLMGVGGVVIAGFTQDVKRQAEHERFLHNQRILKEAKRALLQYAYNYPETAGNGPGRLPCPDTDNDGIPNPTLLCGSPNGIVGRFPWAEDELNFYDARDASGARLWYAVSSRFANNGGISINSATQGTITVQDRSGALLHNATANSGAVAVIIAPGPAIDRNGVLQVRIPGDPTELDRANYLDLFGAVDNTDFIHNNANGFVAGPILDVVTGDLLVNDQMIVITAAEVIAMAEKATLQAYRKAIEDYLANTGGTYPWLYNYAGVTSLAELSSYFPADAVFADERTNNLDNYGRISSIFADYFTLTESQPIETDLKVTVTIDYTLATPVPSTISHGSLPFIDDGIKPEHTLEFTIPAAQLTDVRFTEDAGPNGRLTATLAAAQTFNQVLYFWDEDEGPRTGDWRLCPAGGDELSDCHRDSSQNPNPGGNNDSDEEILRLDLEISLPAGPFTLDADYNAGPGIVIAHIAADVNGHARISGSVQGNAVDLGPATSPSVTASYQYDAHYLDGGGEVFQIEEQGNLVLADLSAGTSLALEMRYYPELPAWAFDNGWHDSIRMAYAADYRPDQNAAAGDCGSTPPCLEQPDTPGGPQDKVSLLVIAGQHNWVDEGVDGYQNDLADVFDPGNQDSNESFYAHDGNDEILVIEEL